MLAHITTQADWASAQLTGHYLHDSLNTQGFIHCSLPTEEQLIAVGNAVFRGQPQLLVLLIDPGRLTSAVVYEEFGPGSPLFPHVYGPINLNAVAEVVPFVPEPDGTFRLSPRLSG